MDEKTNADIYRELNAVSILDYLENYTHNMTMRIHRMNRYRISKQIKNYRPSGKILLPRRNKRLH